MGSGGEPLALPPGHGTPAKTLVWADVEARLQAATHVPLATVRPDGRPHTVPVDGLWVDGTTLFGGSAETVKHRNLLADSRAALPDAQAAVIVEGHCESVHPDAATMKPLITASADKHGYAPLMSAYAGGVWRMRPTKVMAWTPLPVDATRFLFSMGDWAEAFVASVAEGLAAPAVPADAGPMTAYMRHQFPFLVVRAPAQKAVVRARSLSPARRRTRTRRSPRYPDFFVCKAIGWILRHLA